ncbi:MAG TPA: HlyD family efflux transporter periplasmic adaptor subunit [Planctomicrobium sp.]|nr:HlyD family efflux transporter periplasmic adaptor subunit [Planctomicrobium sp.]
MKATSHHRTCHGRRFLALSLLGLGTFAGLAMMPMMSFGIGNQFNRIPADGFHQIEQGLMEVALNERGELQSSSTKSITSHCEWSVNLLWIADEGTYVEKGDIVALLDSSILEQRARQREVLAMKAQTSLQTVKTNLMVQELANESAIAAAQLTLVLSRLELAGYKLAQATQEKHQIEEKIVVAQANLEYAQKKYEYTVRMVELGYKDVSEREADRLDLMRKEQILLNEKNRFITLDRYSRDRKMIELIAKQEEAERALERARLRANAALLNGKIRIQAWTRACNAHQHFLNRLNKNIAACTIRAKQSGQVLHARAGSRSTVTVLVGDLVRYLQPLVQIPDRSRLEVVVRLHESKIRQVEIGQTAVIQVDAHSGLQLTGRITRRGSVPQMGLYPHYNLRDYEVIVGIEAAPDVIELLAPGMSAQTRILVGQNTDAVIAPLETVVGIDGRKVAFVRRGEQIEVCDVETGLANETQVEIRAGLRPGDEVVARPREACASRIESLRAVYDEAGTGISSNMTTASTARNSRY